ncbi:TIGR03936 family radical SAM-associated protein [Chloroflexota bacterium]
MTSEQPMHNRVRITFSKLDSLRFIGHLDLAKTWERVLRRAQTPLAYSQGFNPQPKMQLASALSLGISSECELLDIWLTEDISLTDFCDQLNTVSPVGLRARQAVSVPLKGPALQTILHSSEYRISTDEVDSEELQNRITDFLASEHVERVRRGKPYDLRALVLDMRLVEGQTFWVQLSLGPRGTGRPDELLAAMGLDFNRARCHRTVLHLSDEKN